MNSWVPAIFGLMGVILGAVLTYWREHLLQRKKEKKDAAYLAVVVSAALERFSAACARVVNDDGLCEGHPDEDGCRSAQVKIPKFDPELLDVEWRSLPAELMYDVLDLPYLIELADGAIAEAAEHADPPDYEEFFEQRQYQYAGLGIDAAALVARLRKHAGYPPRPIGDWDVVAHMESHRARFDAKRLARSNQALPDRQPIAAMGHAGADGEPSGTGRSLSNDPQ